MTSDDQPAAPDGLRPETAVICAGRPDRAAGGPLNVPIVLASNFHADADTGQDSRAYSRTDATPGWEALETAVGQVEGGHGW
jgi:cystathionine gamma-synthase